MKNKIFPGYKRIWKLILVMVALVVGLTTGLASVPACADEKIINKEKGNPVPENIGFMKNPPKELTEKFPMCDVFLKVEWIDNEKKIGYSNYEVIIKGKKKMMWALVILKGDVPSYWWDVYQYKRQGRLKEIFERLKKGKSVELHMRGLDEDDSLADHRCTVCVPYPDNKKVWIVEGKKIGKVYTENQINEMHRTLEIFVPGLSKRFFQEFTAVDLNFDGIDDYFEDGWVTYSFGDKYFSMKRGENRFERGRSQFPFSFPPSGRVCTLSSWTGSYLITDGKSFILNNECNLTELTTADLRIKREGKRPAELDIPDEARQLLKRGVEASNAKNSRSAVDLLDKAIEIAPWWAEANYQRGLALADTNKYGAAIHDMRRVQAITGDTPIGRNARDKIKAWQEPLHRFATGQMVKIPAGRFLMGSPDPCDPHCGFCRCAQPQHWVDIKQFEISKYPVTFDQWEACVEDGGCVRRIAFVDRWTGRDLPATSMNWKTVQDFLRWISKKTGKQYRLPSEAEWEYAARAGKTTKYYWGDEVGSGHANCASCGSRWDGKSTSPVGSFAPNAFGLYDMAGNVWQWLEDCDNPNYWEAPTDGSAWTTGNCRARVIRGGSWRDKTVGSTDRRTEETQYGPDNVGFRLARTLE